MLALSDFKHDNPCKAPPNYDWVPWFLPSTAAPIVLNTEAEKAKGTDNDNDLYVGADEVFGRAIN
jgi:hypothetical protein